VEERIPVIDADAHIFESEPDIRKYLQPTFDRRTTSLWPGDQPWDDGLLGTLGNNDPNYEPVPGVKYPIGLPPAGQVEAWHKIMEHSGIERAVAFPSVGKALTTREKDWQIAVTRAYNDYVATEYNALSDRLHCVGILPLRYPLEAAQELRRAATEKGIIAFACHTLGLPLGYGDPIYDLVYAEAERLGVTICFHGTRYPIEEIGADRLSNFSEVHAYAFTVGLLLQFTSVLMEGVPVRFPNLRLAFLEAGVTWLPYYLDRLDEHWEKRQVETPLLTRKPSEITRDSRIWFSVEAGETLLPQTIDFLGDTHFVYATDIPHWDNEFPESLEALRGHSGLSRATRERILYHNPRELFTLPQLQDGAVKTGIPSLV
jgi:predicted TIM-barrel fold metal-dependent hydrolase